MAGSLISNAVEHLRYGTAKSLSEERASLSSRDGRWINWMRYLRRGLLGTMPPKDVCLPGTFDGGMHKAVNLLPAWSQKNFHTGHHGKILSGGLIR
jgi:hypothetical protein